MKIKVAALVNYLAAALLLVMGITYLTKTSFMPYHSEAISLDWINVEKNTRILILALMKGVSGGLIAVSFTISFLQFKFTSSRISWIPFLILIIGIIISMTILYAMLFIKLNTRGNPPIGLTISGTVLLISGFILNLTELRKK